MKKTLIYAGASGMILLFAGLVAASLSLNSLVKKGIETYGPLLTKTDVRVSVVSLLPLQGSGSLRGFEIGNPPGCKERDAISVGRMHLALEPKSLLSSVLVIKQIEVIDPDISFEGTPSANNLTQLQKNVQSFVPPSKPVAGAPVPPGPAKKIIIDDFLLSGAKVKVAVKFLGQEKGLALTLPDIHLTGLGRKTNGMDPKDAVGEVMSSLTHAITQAVTAQINDLTQGTISNLTKGLPSNLGNALGGLFGKKK
jgi:hypothetical protein